MNMNLNEFENALTKLLDDALGSGLSRDDISECAEAIIHNYFLEDEGAA